METPDHIIITRTHWELEFAVDAYAPFPPAAEAPVGEEADAAPSGGGGMSIIDDIMFAMIDIECFFRSW